MFEREPVPSANPVKPEIGALAINGALVETAEICQLGVESDINYLLPNLAEAQKALSGVLQEFNQPQVKPDYHTMLRSGAHYVASFANPHKGYSAGRQIYLEEHDTALNNTYTRHIIPAAAALKNLQAANQKIKSDFDKLTGDEDFDVAARYQIFKAVVYGRNEPESQGQPDTTAALMSVVALGNVDIREQIVQNSKNGIFDIHIAYDLLKLGDRVADDPNAGKIHELLELARADWQRQGKEVGQIESYTNMLQTFDNWPPDYRYLIIGIRQALLKKFEANIDQTKQTLEEEKVIAPVDPETAFKESYLELDKRLEFSTKTTKRKNLNKPESQPLAEKIVSQENKNPRYNLTASHAGGIDGFIEKYVEDTGHNVNGKLHKDLKNLKTHLEHVNLKIGNRYEGIKVIRECRYIWQNGKKRPLYEAKPRDIPGLSTTAINSDDVRVFFIMLEEPDGESELGTLEILDIVTRKNTEQTIKRYKRLSKRHRRV